MTDTEGTARAEAKLQKKEIKQREIEVALAQYRAEARATEEKTARLRAARLAKEAADREAARSAEASAPAKKTRSRKPAA